MYWYLISDRRKGTALIKVRITRDGKVIRSEFTNAAAPGVDPDMMDDISRFVRRVLPPPAKPVASLQMGFTSARLAAAMAQAKVSTDNHDSAPRGIRPTEAEGS